MHGQAVEAVDRGRHLLGGTLTLHPHRPEQDVARKSAGEPVQDVADHRSGRRGHDTDQVRQERQRLLARRVKEPLGGKLFLALLEQHHQRAEACRLERVDDDLVLRFPGIGGEPPGDEDLEPLLGLDSHAREGGPPDHRLDLGAFVLEREVTVAGRMRPAITGDFAAHAHVAERVLHGAPQRRGKFGDRPFPDIEACRFVHRLARGPAPSRCVNLTTSSGATSATNAAGQFTATLSSAGQVRRSIGVS